MWDLVLVIAATAVAMLLLVAFASLLFRENRTREVRRPAPSAQPRTATGPEDDPVWRTVVDPATHHPGAVRPFAVAYARAMTVPDAGSEMPGHRAA
ncbi:hypothetical protein [Jatrophihabitans fulvus]